MKAAAGIKTSFPTTEEMLAEHRQWLRKFQKDVGLPEKNTFANLPRRNDLELNTMYP